MYSLVLVQAVVGHMRLIAIDPGGTTGVATLIDDVYKVTTIRCFTHLSGHGVEWVDCQLLWTFVREGGWDHCVIEGFATPGLISKDGIATIEIIGQLRYICEHHNIPYTVQYPIERHAALKTGDAAQIIVEKIGKKRYPAHELDAMAHMVTWTRNHP